MKFRDLLKTLLVCVLILSMLFSVACSKSQETETSEKTDTSTGECKHTDVKLENQKAATCLEEGYSGDKVCSSCGKTLEQGKTLAIVGHQWDAGTVTKVPTCVSTGVKTVTCKTCFITETQVLETVACDNSYHFQANEKHSLVCGVCYKSTSGDHAKSETIETVEATCLEAGYTLYHCADCDCDFKEYDSEKPALGHVWDIENPVIDPATCSAEGSLYYVCKNEGCEEHTATYTINIAPGVHSFELVDSQDATCTSEGHEMYQCSGCGAEKEKVLAKIPHAYGDVVEDGGWQYKTCDCGHRISAFDASNGDSVNLDANGINRGDAFEITFNNATIEFPSSVVEGGMAGNEVNINAGVIGEDVKEGLLSSSAMAEEDKNVLNSDSSKIYDFSVAAGDRNISNFDENVTITLPYTLGEDEDAEGIVIWYVAPDGELDSISNVLFYDPDGDGEGQVIFEVEHFSYYAIAYKETPEMKCRRGVHDYSNEALWTDFEATCTFYGFTAKECKVCGTTSLDNFVQMKPHNLGEIITPKADCENGRYTHQKCSDCGFVVNYDYIPAVGHKLTSYASCDTAAVCERCFKILVPAYGHDWSEWEIVAEASDTNPGLKRRYCPICGVVEDVKVPVKVNIEAWNVDSYQSFIETVVEEVANMGNGKATVKIEQEGRKYDIQFIVNKDGDVYSAYIKSDVTYKEEIVGSGEVYYQNGKIVAVIEDGTTVTDIDHISTMFPNFKEYYSYIRSAISYYDRNISKGFEMIGKLIDEYIEVFGANANEKLAANGQKYTVEEIREAYKSLNALYVYYIYKLGVESSSGMPEGVEVPTSKDLHNVLSYYMTKSEENGNSVYTYDFANVKKNYLDQIEALEAQGDNTLDKVIYEYFGDIITVHYPELTDWSKLIAHLRSELGGSVKVETLINKIISIAENSEACTASELYDIMGKAFALVTREEIDFELMAQEYSGYTLDEMITMVFGEVDEETGDKISMDWFYNQLDETVKTTKLNSLVVDSYGEESYNPETGHYEYNRVEVTFADRIEKIKDIIDIIDYEGEAKVVLDAEGNIVYFKYDQTSKNTVGEGSEEQTLTVSNFIEYAPTTEKVNIPEEVQKHFAIDVTFSENNNGNVVISGVPAGYDITWDLYGYVSMAIADKVEKSVALSDELGIDVYMLKKEYWTSSSYVDEYLMDANGNFYGYEHEYDRYAEFKSMVAYKDFVADPESLLPKEGDPYVGCFSNNYANGEITYLYSTAAGLFYKQDGVWMAVTDMTSGYYDTEYGCYYFYAVYGQVFSELCENLVISNINTRGTFYNENGEAFVGGQLYIETNNYNNWELNIVMIDSEIYLVEIDYVINDEVLVLGDVITDVPEYDYIESNYSNDEEVKVFKDGEKVEGYTRVSLYKKVPTYYATYDGYYFNMSSNYFSSSDVNYRNPFTFVNVEGMETHTLPDGRTVYVVASVGDIEREGTVYGYIPVTEKLYVQAACKYKNNSLSIILYRDNAYRYSSANKYLSHNIGEVIDINDYITNENGNYVVSSEAIELIKSNCNGYGDSVYLTLSANDAGADVSVELCYNIFTNPIGEYNPQNVIDASVDWNKYFNTEDVSTDNHDFSVNVLENGNIEVTLPDDRVIDVRFEFDMSEVEAEEVLVRNEYKSQNAGYDIYTSKEYNRYWVSYAKYNNKYYSYRIIEIINGYNKMTPDQILKDNWYLGDIDYQYDEINEQGELTGRIYRATLYFDSWIYSTTSSDIMVKIADGKVYVLTGVSHESDIGLKYEGIVEYSNFINGLTLTEEYSGETDNIYYNVNKKLSYTNFEIKYQNEYVANVEYFYYIESGKKQYLKADSAESLYVPNLENSVTLPTGWNQTNVIDISWNGMDYQIVEGVYNKITSRDYVKIGDKFVNVNDIYFYSLREVLSNISEQQYLYGVYNGNEWTYYSEWEWNFETGMLVPVGSPVYVSNPEFLFMDAYQGTIAEGYECYSFNYYDASTVEIQTLSNGVQVYSQPGTTNDCYAKLKDGVFLRGYLMDEGDGYSFIPEWWSRDEFDSRELTGSLNLNASITVNGNKAVINKNILDKLSKYSDSVIIEICGIYEHGYHYYGEINFSELSAWFN